MTEQTGFADSGTTDDDVEEAPVRRPRPRSNKYRVKAYNPEMEVDKTIFSHEDQGAARRYVMTHHPRGREVYVEHPGGYKEHYSADLDHQGSEPWQEFTEEDD